MSACIVDSGLSSLAVGRGTSSATPLSATLRKPRSLEKGTISVEGHVLKVNAGVPAAQQVRTGRLQHSLESSWEQTELKIRFAFAKCQRPHGMSPLPCARRSAIEECPCACSQRGSPPPQTHILSSRRTWRPTPDSVICEKRILEATISWLQSALPSCFPEVEDLYSTTSSIHPLV